MRAQEEGIIVKAAESQWKCNDRGDSWLKVRPLVCPVLGAQDRCYQVGTPGAVGAADLRFRILCVCCFMRMPTCRMLQIYFPCR